MPAKKTAQPKTPKPKKLKVEMPKLGRVKKTFTPSNCSHADYAGAAWRDLPLKAANGRTYQQCAKCDMKRYKPGYEPDDMPVKPRQKKEPVKQKSLFDLSQIPVDLNWKKGKRR
jgi:hypothetical protein